VTPTARAEKPLSAPKTLLIACGALARELLALIRANGWTHLQVTALPAELHNRPQLIPEAVRAKIQAARGGYERIKVVYGDCGTGGRLDAMLAEEGVERIAGPHCYQIYAGQEAFEALSEAELGTFYLTDYMVRQFDSLVMQGLGLDRHPELRDEYFRHYTRLMYLAQTRDAALDAKAREAAARLGLRYEYRFTGFGGLAPFLAEAG
jgi:Protein of unknown function (DUF1638)